MGNQQLFQQFLVCVAHGQGQMVGNKAVAPYSRGVTCWNTRGLCRRNTSYGRVAAVAWKEEAVVGTIMAAEMGIEVFTQTSSERWVDSHNVTYETLLDETFLVAVLSVMK